MTAFDLVVIGGGPAGYAGALRAAELGGRVALVEEQGAGGNCVQHACIPTTILLDSIEAATRAQELAVAGVLSAGDELHFNRAIARKQQLVAGMSAGIRNQLRLHKVEYIAGRARLHSARDVSVRTTDGADRALEARRLLIATGARPSPPALPGLKPGDILTNDAALRLPQAPDSLLVLGDSGAGMIFTIEHAQIFAAFGSRVTLIERGGSLLPNEDAQFVEILSESLRSSGIEILTESHVEAAEPRDEGWQVQLATPHGLQARSVAAVLAPDCRVPYVDGFGLEQTGVARVAGAIAIDEHCATTIDGVYAAGDVTGGAMLSNVAAQQGRVAAENALGRPARVDLRFVPRCLFTLPELASIGLTEAQARAAGYDVRTGSANLLTNARALTMGGREGVVKVVAETDLGQILGVQILGPGAGELIGQALLALRLEATIEDLAAGTPWHPSLAEALSEAARRAL